MQRELVSIATKNVMSLAPHLDKVNEALTQLKITREFVEQTRKDLVDDNAKQIYMVVRRDLDKTIEVLRGLLEEMPTDYQNNTIILVSDIVRTVMENISVNK